mmetsp:Transcript_17034/g.36003  ORF Transcript_17034/g.36003 Transcript_17034/m.36003 type:complete len:81 (+) Transcript_17034:102-344(+)
MMDHKLLAICDYCSSIIITIYRYNFVMIRIPHVSLLIMVKQGQSIHQLLLSKLSIHSLDLRNTTVPTPSSRQTALPMQLG